VWSPTARKDQTGTIKDFRGKSDNAAQSKKGTKGKEERE
jgi:hypothetical protein